MDRVDRPRCAPRTAGTLLSLALALAPTLAAHPAAAEPSGANVEAETLYQRGHALLKDGKVAEACDAFQASLKMESSTGTVLNLGRCREQQGQLATAWALFLRAASMAHNDGATARAAEAQRRAQALEARLSQLTISVPEGSRINGLEVLRDNEPIDPALWNQGMPLDGGTYVIEARAPGNQAWSTRVDVPTEGGRVSIEVPRFKSLAQLASGSADEPAAEADAGDKAGHPVPVRRPDAATGALAHQDHGEPSGRRTWSGMRYGAVATAAVGVGALVAGGLLGSASSSAADQANALCPDDRCSDPEALRLADQSQSRALQANVSFAVGGAALAGAVVLWFLGAPDEPEKPRTISFVPAVSASASGFAVRWRF